MDERAYQYLDGERDGPVVHHRTKVCLLQMLTTQLGDDHLSALTKTILVPSNVEVDGNKHILCAPKLNTPMWQRLPKEGKNNDKKVRMIECLILKTIISITYVVDGLLKNPGPIEGDDKKLLADKLWDAAQLLCAGNYKCLELREILMHRYLGVFRKLCGKNIQYTEDMFGDQLAKTFKSEHETNLIVKTMEKEEAQSQKST